MHPTLHSDPITGTKVIYAPQRAQRTNAFAEDLFTLPDGAQCPFCPGNETLTPAELYAIRSPGSPPNHPGWQLRIIPNAFPAVVLPSPSVGEGPGGANDSTPALGHHELLIESPNHDDSWTTLPTGQLALVLLSIRVRLLQWSQEKSILCAHIFKNVGCRAGASLAHPHLQLMGMAFTPHPTLREMERSQQYLHQHHSDYWSTLCSAKVQSNPLIIHQDDFFTTLCPPVSKVPYEAWLLPNQPAFHYHHLADADCDALAGHLQLVMNKLNRRLGPVTHNIIWRLPPLHDDPKPWYRWRIEIVPRLTSFAGFELGAGIYINPIPPQQAARDLNAP